MLVSGADVRARRADAGAVNLLEADLEVGDAEELHLFDQRALVAARSDERAERHVAADAGEAVEVECARHASSSGKTSPALPTMVSWQSSESGVGSGLISTR